MVVAEADPARADETLRLPASINALLEARLDSLDPVERRVLERAAVAGRNSGSGRSSTCPRRRTDPSVAGSLLALVRKGLIRPAPARLPADDAYRFRHALIRDAAYAGMPKAVRASLHERYAGWLQSQGGRTLAARRTRSSGTTSSRRSVASRRARAADRRDPPARGGRGGATGLAAGARAFAREDMPAAAGLLGRAAALLRQAIRDAWAPFETRHRRSGRRVGPTTPSRRSLGSWPRPRRPARRAWLPSHTSSASCTNN